MSIIDNKKPAEVPSAAPTSPTNKTMISISYRNSQPEEGGNNSKNRKELLLAKLAQDLQQHRSTEQQSPNTPANESFKDRLIREAFEDMESEKNASKNIKTKFHGFINKDKDGDDDSDTDSGSDIDVLPDMITSEPEANGDSDDSDDSSKDSHMASNSSLTKNGKVSNLLKNVVNNNKKYTKFMKKNITKTSKFIVNKTQELANDTSDMVKKLKQSDRRTSFEGTTSSEPGAVYLQSSKDMYYPEEYDSRKHSKNKLVFNNSNEADDKKSKKTMFDKFSSSGQDVKNFARKFGFKKNDKGERKQSSSTSALMAEPTLSKDKANHSALALMINDEVNRGLGEQPQLLGLQSKVPEETNQMSVYNLSTGKITTNGQHTALTRKPAIVPMRAAPPRPPPHVPTVKPAAPPTPEDHSTPPVAPIRRKRNKQQSSPTLYDSSEVTLEKLKLDFERFYNADHQLASSTTLDDRLDIINEIKFGSKLFSLFHCKSRDKAENFYLLVSLFGLI